MHIALISPIFPPFPPPASLRPHGFALAWAQLGHDVTVITAEKAPKHRLMPRPSPGVRVIEVPTPAPAIVRWLRRRHEGSTGSRVAAGPTAVEEFASRGLMPGAFSRLRLRTGIYGGMRMPDLSDHWVRPAIAAAEAEGPFDLVVSSAGPYTAHRVAEHLRRHGVAARWVADYRDLWTDNPTFSGLPPFSWYERWLENRWMPRMDLITTVSEGLAEGLRRRTDVPVHVVPNGVTDLPDEYLDTARAFPDDGRRRLVYTGTVYPDHQDMTALLKGLARLHADPARPPERIPQLVVAGYDTRPWREGARRHGVEHLVECRGFVDHDTSLRMQRDADALVILDWDDPARGVITSKIFEYAVAGPPILVIGGPGTNASPIVLLLRESGHGHVVGNDAARAADFLAALGDGITPPATPPAASFDPDRFNRRHQAKAMLELAAGPCAVSAPEPEPPRAGRRSDTGRGARAGAPARR